ncbi:MAG: hypothetical protein L0229_11650 [Blastocatellia bacterium]|nr:hypothetical protein [Blastocatellia bacterium]
MSLDELLPTLRELDRADKLRVMQFLAFELAREEGALPDSGTHYPVWSPFDSFEAGNTLLAALGAENEHA